MEKSKEKNPKKGKKVKVFTKKKKTLEPENVVIEKLKSQYGSIDPSTLKKFTDLPISFKTIKGLKESKYYNLTDIQKESIGLALRGQDILGAAQTGSGKTLAFLVPIIERLYCEQWTKLDGVGALVITPTRELAYQIFETLRRIGKYHDFSAGLIIGGKDLKFERRRMDQCNIIICTPGRLLQHMDENPLFDCVNMRVLVLDEADRCLDMGFKETMNSIIANLPPKRQTLLFSATQTKSIQDLARLSLKDPSYVSVNEMQTPKELQQSYVVCEIQDKLPIIWSFIRNHLKQKTIIFFSTCKQVKYFYEMFCKLRPGLSLLPLYGTLHQLRRMKIYEEFCRKQSAVLFATDLAARGLDFPEVHWVVQADCPEDIATYIHRVGRTARYYKGGESLMLLLPSELKMVEYLEEKKLPIEKIEINPAKLQNPVRKMEVFLVKDQTLKDTAQRAVSHYARAIYFMKHKDVFDVQALDFDSFSNSLGLKIPPRIRFLDRMNRKQQIGSKTESSKQDLKVGEVHGQNKKVYFGNEDQVEDGDNSETKKEVEKMKRHKKNSSSGDSGILDSDEDNVKVPEKMKDMKAKNSNKNFSVSDSDSEDDVLKVKRKHHDIETPVDLEPIETYLDKKLLIEKNERKKKPITRAAVVKKMLKKNLAPNKKIVFDDEGAAIQQGTKESKSELARQFENEDAYDIEKARLVLREEDKFDKQLFKAKVKAKHKEERRKLKEQRKQEEEGEKDEFGESDSDEGPDLSWLPDPDKIYGKKSEDDDEEHDDKMENTYMEGDDKEDEFDKEIYKEKVKAKHKKKRSKLKKQRMQEEGEEDEFGENNSNEGPDLSWLPDPDKMYGKKTEDDDEEHNNEMENISMEADEKEVEKNKKKEKKSKKRKAKGMDNLETVLKRKKKHQIDEISANLNVNETEELAMLLLRGK